jgi:hypothetical protein
MGKKNNVRKIKCLGNCISKGDKYLHPIKLTIEQNDKIDTCPTKNFYDDFTSSLLWNKKCITHEKLSASELSKYMAVPYLNLSITYLLKMYNIENIDDLNNWINENILENKPYKYINRIINCWIKENLTDLIKNNNILSEIYLKIQKNYWKIKIDDKDFLKKSQKFISKFFKNIDLSNFNFNLGENLLKHFEN